MNIHIPRKRFGQNFLVDPNIIRQIIQAIDPKPDDAIVEIGPGLGALTQVLLPMTKHLTVIELDRDLISPLRMACVDLGELIIHQADALKFDFSTLETSNKKLRIVGNLPYNISTALIFHLLTFQSLIKDMHFMLQQEVVERLAAAPGSKAYGRLSVMVQYHCQVEPLFQVPPTAFRPAPKVYSAIVRLTPYETPPYHAENPELFAKIVNQAFQQRRKTLRNCLKGIVPIKCLEDLGIDPQLRPEQLSLKNYVEISNLTPN
ncbi:MAG: 16S rRNA (adenine(1518)-N(6)/adenine(1519)-N(6))-dimethyltransferase RsmA [Proteobacteria bacterium]|nr:16S rRNA (adenine(1518)-N(6)/adenine(1519)-N(6))-dimethyltransferase RsmA [Pseudomonadota bacterium]